jgi:transposase-like protein
MDRKKRAAYYRRILSQRSPGATVEQFCKTHGIHPWTYYFWRKKLGIVKAEPRLLPAIDSTPSFITVSPRTHEHALSNTTKVALPNGISIQFPAALTAEQLQVIALLKTSDTCLA